MASVQIKPTEIVYTTKDGDVLDDIIFKNYGRGIDLLQTVLLANPGLADRGAVYPSGIKIVLPALTAKEKIIPTIRPWGTF